MLSNMHMYLEIFFKDMFGGLGLGCQVAGGFKENSCNISSYSSSPLT